MTIGANLSEFSGLPVVDLTLDDDNFDFEKNAPRLRLNYSQFEAGMTITDLFAAMARNPGVERARALVIGNWGFVDRDSTAVVEALVAYRDCLPALRALFIGDITYEENEISWIVQSDLSAIWPSYPELEHIQVRGGSGLGLGRIASPALKTLVIEAGGLPRRVVHEALSAQAPNLEHLEIWTGSDNYGADSTPEDFATLFAGELFPALKTLALRDCEYADALARAVAEAPVLARINTLDLSLGNLSDAGAEALLASPLVAGLKNLDLHHHYLSDAMMERVRAWGSLHGVIVDLEGQEEEDQDDDEVYRYIAVSE